MKNIILFGILGLSATPVFAADKIDKLHICGALLDLGFGADEQIIQVVDGRGQLVSALNDGGTELEDTEAIYGQISGRTDRLWQLLQTKSGVESFKKNRAEIERLVWFNNNEDLVEEQKALFFIRSEAIDQRGEFEPNFVQSTAHIDLYSVAVPAIDKQILMANVIVKFYEESFFRRALSSIQESLKSRKASANLIVDPKNLRISIVQIEMDEASGAASFTYMIRKFGDPTRFTESVDSAKARIDRAKKLSGFEKRADDLVNLVNFPNGEEISRSLKKPFLGLDWKLERQGTKATLSASKSREWLGPVSIEITSELEPKTGRQVILGKLVFDFPTPVIAETGIRRVRSLYRQSRGFGDGYFVKLMDKIVFDTDKETGRLTVSNIDLSDKNLQKLFQLLTR